MCITFKVRVAGSEITRPDGWAAETPLALSRLKAPLGLATYLTASRTALAAGAGHFASLPLLTRMEILLVGIGGLRASRSIGMSGQKMAATRRRSACADITNKLPVREAATSRNLWSKARAVISPLRSRREGEPMIGWVLLSRQAVARAAEALEGDDHGVRDEVGFLSLHQALADRLFPGTSVLQTRARYALLVPWVMRQVAEAGDRDGERRLRHAEGLLAGQLVKGQDAGLDAKGAIGARVWRRAGRPPSQPPSFSYWNALARWGILSPRPDNTTPSRAQALRQLASAGRRRAGGEDDPHPDESAASPFVALPRRPLGLGDPDFPLDLVLPTKSEVSFADSSSA